MAFRRKIVILFYLSCLSQVSPFEIVDPEQPDVNFGGMDGKAQIINVDEKNPTDQPETVKFAKITNVALDLETIYKCDNLNNLNVEQEKDEVTGNVYLKANYIDYDIIINGNDFCLIRVNEVGKPAENKQIKLTIINLDDEPPIFVTGPCAMEENAPITVDNSLCEFTIEDPDGNMASMQFQFDTTDYDNLFGLEYKTPPESTAPTSKIYLTLKNDEKLDYETINIYSFKVLALDQGGLDSSVPVNVIVRVVDVSDEPPVWKTFKSAYTFPENTEQTIPVEAKDGDFGIDATINYKLMDETFATIDVNRGEIKVIKIDRDIEGQDQITLNVVAYEAEDTTSAITGDITLYITDEDDNSPLVLDPTNPIISIETLEGSFNDLTITVQDIDLGENAMYTISLTSAGDFHNAFIAIPQKGFQEMSFTVSATNLASLDFENEAWREFELEFITQGTVDTTRSDKRTIKITLTDWNDETPVFASSTTKVNVSETIKAGELVAEGIIATDGDPEDINKKIKHSLIGTTAQTILTIEEFGGKITTLKDNAFDYEKQSEMIIQIIATDNAEPPHVGTTELTITIIDVNDEKPRLVVGSTIAISELIEVGEPISADITATDDDSDADLEFSIDWDNSYANKNSRKVDDPNVNIKCIEVKTTSEETGHAKAELTVLAAPDFEKFDTLYLRVVVTDKNNKVEGMGADTATIVFNILNENDNPPVFKEGTETELRQVTENAATNSVITTVSATDDDGDDVYYSIEPIDDTPSWVAIEETTGIIKVSLSGDDKIDCDANKIDTLNYLVKAKDFKDDDEDAANGHTTEAKITISIIDQNDEDPEVDDLDISIEENTDDGTVLDTYPLVYRDNDLSDPYHTVECTIRDNNVEISSRFTMVNNLITISLADGYTLDRDETEQFQFDLYCIDNPTNENQEKSRTPQNPPTITITLTDVNDNEPTIINGDKISPIDESQTKGIIATLEGQDKDSEENGAIEYLKINKVERFNSQDNVNPLEELDVNLFLLESLPGGKNGQISFVADGNLAGKFGYLKFDLSLQDKGTPPLVPTSPVIVGLEVKLYNFAGPTFKDLEENDQFFLLPEQPASGPLKLYNNELMPDFKASDNQGEKYSIKFSLEDATNTFEVSQIGRLGLLTHDYNPDDKFTLIITATYDIDSTLGNAPFNTSLNFMVGFLDPLSTDPIFETNTEIEVRFDENDESKPTFQLPKASYEQGDLEDLPVFYLLTDGDEDENFQVDQTTGIVTLIKPLDYEIIKELTLTFQSSNSEKPNTNPSERSLVKRKITVIDLNDNFPIFDDPKLYTATLRITDQSQSQSSVTTVHASDLDTLEKFPLCYQITAVKGSTSSIDNLKDPFTIDLTSGAITPNFTPKATMEGYFNTTVTVQDQGKTGDNKCAEVDADHKDDAQVRIFLITDKNLVNFKFLNQLDNVVDAREEILKLLVDNFNDSTYSTQMETPTHEQQEDGTEVTTAPIIFVDMTTSKPVDATEIYKKFAKVSFFRQIYTAFQVIHLNLQSFEGEATDMQNLAAILQAWLIGVAVVLGSLCMILTIAFILKTRQLKQRIDNLSSTKFGSQESGLNRAGVAAPTTNKHAIEGSNPVFSTETEAKEVEERRESVTSGGSELIGVEDDDKFNFDYPDKDRLSISGSIIE